MPNMTDPKIFENITKPMRYRASYVKKNYTVIWKNWDGTVLKTESIPALTRAIPPNTPTKQGCDFIGWDKEYTKIISDTEIIALFSEPTYYTVIWRGYNDVALKTEKVLMGDSATPPTVPQTPGKKFKCWSQEYSCIMSNLEIKAVYDDYTFTVTWLGINEEVLKQETVNGGESATPPTPPIVEHYTFSHWDSNYSNVTVNTTIKAVYKATMYTVSWVDRNGNTISTVQVASGSSATPPTPPTVEHYTFSHWDGDYSNVTVNTTIKAVYKATMYTVSWVDYDGTVLKSESKAYGETATPPTDPTRDGYEFKGWGTTDYTVKGDVTFTAQYEEVKAKTLDVFVKDTGFNRYISDDMTILMDAHPFHATSSNQYSIETGKCNRVQLHVEYDGKELSSSEYTATIENTTFFTLENGLITRKLGSFMYAEVINTTVTITYKGLTRTLKVTSRAFKLKVKVDWSGAGSTIPITITNNGSAINFSSADLSKYFIFRFYTYFVGTGKTTWPITIKKTDYFVNGEYSYYPVITMSRYNESGVSMNGEVILDQSVDNDYLDPTERNSESVYPTNLEPGQTGWVI